MTKTKVKKTAKPVKKSNHVLSTKVKKPALVAKAKAATKPVKSVAKKPAPSGSPKGFMWKLLERKTEEQRLKAEQNQVHPGDTADLKDRGHSPNSASGFGRFVGPRRRAG